MEISSDRLPISLLTLLAPISWGTTYVTVTELLPSGRPLLVAAARVSVAGGVLLLLARLRRRPTGRSGTGQRAVHTAVLALFNFALFFPLLVVAVYRLPGGVAASFGGVQPLLVAAVSWVVMHQRPARREIGVGVIAVVGVALVVIRPGASFDPLGVVAALAANVSFSIGAVLSKRLPAPDDRVRETGRQLALSAAVIVPLALWVEGFAPHLSVTNVVGFGYLGVIATAGAFVLWFRGIEKLPTHAPPLLGLAAPVTGAVLGWVLLGESLSPIQLLGFVMTVSAVARGAIGTSDHRPHLPRLALRGL